MESRIEIESIVSPLDPNITMKVPYQSYQEEIQCMENFCGAIFNVSHEKNN